METPSPSQKPNPNDKKSLLQVLSHSITPIINNLHNDESLVCVSQYRKCQNLHFAARNSSIPFLSTVSNTIAIVLL